MVNKRGISLIELLVGVSLGAMLIFAVSQLLSFVTKNTSTMQKSFDTQNNLLVVTTALQKYLVTGETRYFAFSGNGSGTGNVPFDQTLARMIIPQVGICGDLTTSPDCVDDAAMVYIQANKAELPYVSAICQFNANHLLVDLNNPTYGVGTFASPTITVSPGTSNLTGGTIKITNKTLFALANPPTVSLWLANGTASNYAVAYNPVTKVFTPSLPAECIAQLQTDPVTYYKLDGLYKIHFKPFILTQFTGGNTVSANEIQASIGQFPMPLYSPKIRSVGRKILSNQAAVLGIFDCSTASGSISCSPDPIFSTPNVTRVRIDEYFTQALGTDTQNFYEIISCTMTPSSVCALPQCKTLTLDYPAAIPVLWSPQTHNPLCASSTYGPTYAESFQNINSEGFSLFKQQLIQKLRIRIQVDKQKEQSVYVLFQ